jgi:hypothetical protein
MTSGDKIAEHDLEHRPLAGHGGPHRHAKSASLGNGGIDHPLCVELHVETFGLFEYAAGRAHVLTNQNHVWVAPHLVE